MEHDYRLLLENLKRRRYDEALKESALSESFYRSGYSDCLRYTLESMLEIDPAYAYKVYAVSRKIHDKIAKSLERKGYKIDYRYQGELKTYSNILLYGDVEIIVIKKNISDKPHIDIQTLAMDLMEILQGDPNFKSLDYSDKTRIRITALKPTCEIDILPSVWIDSAEYIKTKNEIYRGIAEFDFRKKKVKKYLPFLNIARINARDELTKGTFKSISRLLKTLRADAEGKISLTNAEINALLYSMPVDLFMIPNDQLLSLLPKVDETLQSIYLDTQKFNAILSPSEKDRVFAGRPEKQGEIGKLKDALGGLIKDLREDLDSKGMKLDSKIEYATSIT